MLKLLPPLHRCAARIMGPGLCVVYAFLAATHAQLGQSIQARDAIAAALRIYPAYTIEKLTRSLPYNNQRDVAHFVDGLRRAGLPIASDRPPGHLSSDVNFRG
jgi:hypothetical protein